MPNRRARARQKYSPDQSAKTSSAESVAGRVVLPSRKAKALLRVHFFGFFPHGGVPFPSGVHHHVTGRQMSGGGRQGTGLWLKILWTLSPSPGRTKQDVAQPQKVPRRETDPQGRRQG